MGYLPFLNGSNLSVTEITGIDAHNGFEIPSEGEHIDKASLL